MTRPALAAERALRVLDLLVAHPTERFTLAEIQRATHVNPASAHAIMMTLARSGYVSRHADNKTFSLGPATVAAGQIALEQLPAVRCARDRLDALSESLGLEVVLTAATDDEMIFVGRSSGSSEFGSVIHVGQRVPMHPPIGAVYVAWATDDAVERWLARVRPALSEHEREVQLRALQLVRRRGYSAVVETAATGRLGTLIAEVMEQPGSRRTLERHLAELTHSAYHLDEIDEEGLYDVNNLAAPIFDASGRVAAAFAVNGLRPGTSGREIVEIADRVRGTAQIVTKETYGVPPGARAR